MRYGNADFIAKTLVMLRELNASIGAHFGYAIPRPHLGTEFHKALRELDGRIALSVFARPVPGAMYMAEGCSEWPYAIATPHSHTGSFSVLADTIEFSNLNGPGFILMSAAKVPPFTTEIRAAFQLIPATFGWTISSTGLVKMTDGVDSFREKLWSPELSLCAIGLLIQARLRENVVPVDILSGLQSAF